MEHKKRLISYLLLYNFIGFTVAIGGWVWEVCLFLIKEHQFVNRGFFYGPWLPVYGVGAILLSLIFYHKNIAVILTYAHFGMIDYPQQFYHSTLYTKLRSHIHRLLPLPYQAYTRTEDGTQCNPVSFPCPVSPAGTDRKHTKKPCRFTKAIRSFFICMLGGSFLEFLVGWLLWHVFHQKYWDYSGYVGNISGYVCLFSALGFGIFGSLWIHWIAPRLIRCWSDLQLPFRFFIMGMLDILFLTDVIFSCMQPNTGAHITFSYFMLYLS